MASGRRVPGLCLQVHLAERLLVQAVGGFGSARFGAAFDDKDEKGLGWSDSTTQARKPPSWYVPSAPGRPHGRRGCTSAAASSDAADRIVEIVTWTLAVAQSSLNMRRLIRMKMALAYSHPHSYMFFNSYSYSHFC